MGKNSENLQNAGKACDTLENSNFKNQIKEIRFKEIVTIACMIIGNATPGQGPGWHARRPALASTFLEKKFFWYPETQKSTVWDIVDLDHTIVKIDWMYLRNVRFRRAECSMLDVLCLVSCNSALQDTFRIVVSQNADTSRHRSSYSYQLSPSTLGFACISLGDRTRERKLHTLQ